MRLSADPKDAGYMDASCAARVLLDGVEQKAVVTLETGPNGWVHIRVGRGLAYKQVVGHVECLIQQRDGSERRLEDLYAGGEVAYRNKPA